jgi:hypothetical protein
MPDGKDPQGRTPAEIARELDKIDHEAHVRAERHIDGGLDVEDVLKVAAQPIDSAKPPRDNVISKPWDVEYGRQQQQQREQQRREGKEDLPPSLWLTPRDAAPPPPGGGVGIKLDPELASQFLLSMLRSDRRFISTALIIGGVWMLILAFTAARTQYVVVRSEPFVLITPTVAPQTTPPGPAGTQAATALSAGPIVATFSGTTTSYTVEAVQGNGLKYQWAHSATCGTHTGETTANYLWDHPHPPCPDEPFHSSFITVQVTDSAGFALVRQYPTLGSRPGRGAVPAGGGVFATQTPFPTTAVRTTTPATTAVPTASPNTTTIDGGPNYPLGLGGLVLTAGGLGLAYIGRKEKDPCAELRRRDSAAKARRDAAQARAAQLEQLRSEADRTRAEADRTQRAERASKDDRHSWWEDAETGVRTYTNAGDRGRIEHAEAAARDARAAADSARSAYDAAGGATAVASSKADQQRADADLVSADAALAACEKENAPRAAAPTPTPTPTPVPPPAPPVAPPPPPTPTPAPPSGPAIAKAAPTAVRVCRPGARKPDNEPITHEYRVVDLRSATIVGHGEVSLSEGADGNGPSGERGSGAFPELFRYWRDATDIGLGRIRNAVTRDERLQVLGEYSIRYTVRLFTITCTTWEECKADGSGYERRHRAGLVETGQTEEQTPPVVADVEHVGGNTVKRQVLKVVTGIGLDLQKANRDAEDAAKKFTADCR